MRAGWNPDTLNLPEDGACLKTPGKMPASCSWCEKPMLPVIAPGTPVSWICERCDFPVKQPSVVLDEQ